MPKTKKLWWGYTKNLLRAYPSMPEGREKAAVAAALATVAAMDDGELRLLVIRDIFFRQSLTIHGAALRWVRGDYAQAKRIVAETLDAVAREMGLME